MWKHEGLTGWRSEPAKHNDKMQIEINGVKEAIQAAQIEIINLDNKIRDSKWEAFDFLQQRISTITDEANFLIELMEGSDLFDDGQLTRQGQAVIGLHAVNYDVLMAQADKYGEEVKNLNAEISRNSTDKNLISRRDELLKLQQESIIAAQQEKEAISDLVEEGINNELDSLKDLISAYEDSLDSAKDYTNSPLYCESV